LFCILVFGGRLYGSQSIYQETSPMAERMIFLENELND